MRYVWNLGAWLTVSIIQQRPRQTRPWSRSAGSSLFLTAGIMRSGKSPWNTELSCSDYRQISTVMGLLTSNIYSQC